MSTVTLESATVLDTKMITAMLSLQDKIIIAAKHSTDYWIFSKPFSLFQYNRDSGPDKIFEDYKKIPDMATVEASSFAFIDQGVWSSSDIHLVELKIRHGKEHWQSSKIFSTESNCCGITFTEGHYFLTFSGYINSGYVGMLDSTGRVKHRFNPYSNGSPLFSPYLSKIHVEPDFMMYVSDIGKRQLNIIKVSSVGWRPTVEAEYDNTVANSIVKKRKHELFIAVGGKKNEVVLYSKHGPKKIIQQNELRGTPTALCLVGEVLFVATTEADWLSTQTRIQAYKDNKQKRKDEHVISM